jgi:NAD+ kinase
MKLAVFGSKYQKDKLPVIRRLFDKLREKDMDIRVDSAFLDFLSEEMGYVPDVNGTIEGDDFDADVAISVGGDGTFLRTAARINRRDIPILGINTGRLGFLADISGNEIDDTIEDIYKGYYRVEERSLLSLEVEGEARYEGYNYALNEVALLKQDSSSMITIHTHLGDDYLTSYQADGLVIATPTGSTAYSMSVDGPIILPECSNFVLSPVAPHSLNDRPLVIPDSYVISLVVESRSGHFLVSMDGRSETFDSDTKIKVFKAPYTTKIIKRYRQTFYQTLRNKLMWGADVRK